ncbi:MAG TPA: hypothetical protein QGF02_01225 [Candidatus Babeliales bacterium]|nr:hypothetical protein [Candidatus Babeliales bacterium]
MKQKLILSLLVGSMACGLTAKAKVKQPETAQEKIVATSRLAKLKKATEVTTNSARKALQEARKAAGVTRNVTFYSARKALQEARKVAGTTGDATFYTVETSQKIALYTAAKAKIAYEDALQTPQGAFLRKAVGNRETVGASVLAALGYATYKRIRA